jgi:nitrous oxidase accessory protein
VSQEATSPDAAASPTAPGREGSSGLRGILRHPRTAIAAVLGGTVILIVAGIVPVWGTRLLAPQYPKGLGVWIYGGRAEGDLREINGLNHYVGMMSIDLGGIPELALWPLVIVAAGVFLGAAVFLRGPVGRLALLGLWLVPVGILADIQRWLISYGQDLDPTAALRLDPFIPLAIGPTTVWNFTIWTYPGPGLVLLALVALLATLARRAERPALRVRAWVSAIALVALVAATLLVIMPAVAAEDEGEAGARASPPAGTVDLEALVANAPAGTIVTVPAGSYRTHLVIDRSITLVAGGEVLLDGGGRGTVVTVAAPDVTLRGFRIENSGGQVEEAAGIEVRADGASLEGNRIERTFTGIFVRGGRHVRIVDNTIVGSGQVTVGAEHATARSAGAPDARSAGSGAASPNPADPHAAHAAGPGPGGQGDAISLWNVRGALVRGNRISDARDGVFLNFAEDVLLDSNTVERSRYAVHAMFGSDVVAFGNTLRGNLSGLVFMNTVRVEAGRNTILDDRSPGTGFGIVLKDVAGVRLVENVILRNRTGLQAEGTVDRPDAEASVVHNRFGANGVGVALMATADLTFGGNAFDGNLVQVLALEPGVEHRNRWTYRGFGNTWSDYEGYDLAGDGTGDVAHRSGGSAQVLLGAAPALEAYRTTPALAVLDAAQAIWDAGRPPAVLDRFPLTVDVAPPPPGGGSGGLPVAWSLLGLGFVGGAAGILVRLARPARPSR